MRGTSPETLSSSMTRAFVGPLATVDDSRMKAAARSGA